MAVSCLWKELQDIIRHLIKKHKKYKLGAGVLPVIKVEKNYIYSGPELI